MLSIGMWFVAVLFAMAIRLGVDRGSREVLSWNFRREDYIEHVSALDRQYLVRDWVGRVMRAWTRTRVTVATLLQVVVVLGALALIHLTGLSAMWCLLPFAIWLGRMPTMNVAVLRESGFYGLEFGRRQWSVLIAGTVVTILTTWAALVLLYRAAFEDSMSSWSYWVRLATAVAVLVVMDRLSNWLFRRVLRSASRPTFGAASSRSTILYLRSFTDDRAKMFSPIGRGYLSALLGASRSIESVIADALQSEGELVAIGRPGEKLPEIGAIRSYWPDDQWQDAVRVTAARAQAIVMLVGSTAGLRWEVENLRGWNVLPKTLFVIPPGTMADTLARVNRLVEDLAVPPTELGVLENTTIDCVAALRVDHQGRLVVHTVNGRDWANYTAALWCFRRDMDGGMRRPEPGELSRLNGYG